MRHFAITGIVTASWISRTLSGSAMRATPPSRRMSAGTRSRAITATAPDSSAIRACSASITSMITPPLSISASPVLTRIVPVSCIAVSLAREERLDGAPELVRLLQEEHVTGVVEHDQLGAGDAVGDRARGDRPADEVVGAGDHQSLRLDPREVGPHVELLGVEDLQRRGARAVARAVEPGPVPLVPAREVERRHRAPQVAEVALVVVAALLAVERVGEARPAGVAHQHRPGADAACGQLHSLSVVAATRPNSRRSTDATATSATRVSSRRGSRVVTRWSMRPGRRNDCQNR